MLSTIEHHDIVIKMFDGDHCSVESVNVVATVVIGESLLTSQIGCKKIPSEECLSYSLHIRIRMLTNLSL